MITKEIIEHTEQIKNLIQRIKNHVFVTDEEINIVNDIDKKMVQLESLPGSIPILNSFEEILQRIDCTLIERESAPEERTKEIKIFGTGLDALEANLLLSIDKEQATQNKTSNIFLVMLLVGVGIVASILIRMVFQEDPTWVELSGQIFALLSSIYVLSVLSRLTQSAREAAERMDEKSVAIKFIRYGLKIQMERPNESDMLKAGIGMLLSYQSNRSTPLSREDFVDFSKSLNKLFSNQLETKREKPN